MTRVRIHTALAVCGSMCVAPALASPAVQQAPPAVHQPSPAVRTAPAPPPPTIPEGVPLPPGYVIGAEDILTVVFWKDKDMSADVAVRPDGKVTLPLINDIEAAGKTPDELRTVIAEAASRFVEQPTVSVVVKQINSRKVFITGMVGKSGAYALGAPTTVLQLISMAGGLGEFAHTKEIIINRMEKGRQIALKFNYDDVRRGKNLKQNIELKPGDTVIVP